MWEPGPKWQCPGCTGFTSQFWKLEFLYMGSPPGGGFAVDVFLRDGDAVYRTWHSAGRGTEQPLVELGALRPIRRGSPPGVSPVGAAHPDLSTTEERVDVR